MDTEQTGYVATAPEPEKVAMYRKDKGVVEFDADRVEYMKRHDWKIATEKQKSR